MTAATPTAGLYFHDGIAAGNRHALRWSSSTVIRLFGGLDVDVFTTGVDSAWHVMTSLYNGASSQAWRDGTGSSVVDAGTNTMTGLTAGAAFSLGGAMIGDIASILVYNASLGSNRNPLEKWLGVRWGVTVV